MGAIVSMSSDVQRVEPGESAVFTLRVRNSGSVVDEYTFETVSDGASWITVDPPVLPLFPDSEETVRVMLAPPRDASAPTGPFTFGVKANSREDPANSAVAEATIEIGSFSDLFGELVPRTVRGRRKAKAELAMDNRGNLATDIELEGYDADGNLQVALDPPALKTDPGTATFAKVKLRPKKRFFRGTAKTLPYQVVATPPLGEPVVTDGTMMQEPLLPPWFLRALILAILLLALLAVLWFALLKPTVESAAEDAAEDAAEQVAEDAIAGPIAQQADQISALEQATTGTTTPQAETGEAEGQAEGAGGLAGLGEPFDTRLAASAEPGESGTQTVTVGDGQVLSITDVFLQNPQGDAGRIRIRRGGAVLLDVALQNFRDLDYHFVSPLTFQGGQDVVLEVSCEATPSDRCRDAAYLTGFLETLES